MLSTSACRYCYQPTYLTQLTQSHLDACTCVCVCVARRWLVLISWPLSFGNCQLDLAPQCLRFGGLRCLESLIQKKWLNCKIAVSDLCDSVQFVCRPADCGSERCSGSAWSWPSPRRCRKGCRVCSRSLCWGRWTPHLNQQSECLLWSHLFTYTKSDELLHHVSTRVYTRSHVWHKVTCVRVWTHACVSQLSEVNCVLSSCLIVPYRVLRSKFSWLPVCWARLWSDLCFDFHYYSWISQIKAWAYHTCFLLTVHHRQRYSYRIYGTFLVHSFIKSNAFGPKIELMDFIRHGKWAE